MTAEKNIKLLNAFTILTNMSFIIAVIVPYYRDRMGLTFHDFLIGEAAFAAVVVLLEVPSGWLSDVWMRKHVLALAALFDVIGYTCLLFGDSLIWAIAAQSIIGIGVSLISGTNTALLYDTLLSANRTDEFRKREGKRGGLGFYSVAFASVVSGFIYAANPLLPVLFSVILLTISLVLACCIDEPSRHKKRPEKHPVKDMIDTAHYALRGHVEIGLIILFAAVMFSSTKLIMWSQQPYYMVMKLPEIYYGVLMAAGFFLAGFSSQMGHKLDGKVRAVPTLIIAWMIGMVVSFGASLHVGWPGVALLMVGGSCLYGLAGPRVSEAINLRVGSERRATILSTQNLMVSLCFIPVSLMIGRISDNFGISGALLAITGWMALGGICLTIFAQRSRLKRLMML